VRRLLRGKLIGVESLAEKCFFMVERFNFVGGFGIQVEEIGSKGKCLRKLVAAS